MRQRDAAICLRTTDYSETSQVVHFLTRAGGVVRLIAKGAKRSKSKSGGAIDLMSEGDLVYIPAAMESLGTLVEFSETVSRGPLRRSAERLHAALYMVELIGLMLADDDPHPEVFDLLHNALARLAQPDSPTQAVLAYFQWRLLKLTGLLGDLRRCVACGKEPGGAKDEVFFTSFHGGLLCRNCELSATEKYRLDAAARAGLAALSAVSTGAKVALPEAQARAVNRLLAYHVEQQLGRALKMTRHAIGR